MVDSMEEPEILQNRAVQEVHILMEDGCSQKEQIFGLREFLFGNSGNCSVYFHINAEKKSYTVKANAQIAVPGTKEFLNSLKNQAFVKDAWAV